MSLGGFSVGSGTSRRCQLLNQTVYFLRRVFEEPYREDESANYVHHDGEVIRLDAVLATSQSGKCRLLAERARLALDEDGDRSTEPCTRGLFRGRFRVPRIGLPVPGETSFTPRTWTSSSRPFVPRLPAADSNTPRVWRGARLTSIQRQHQSSTRCSSSITG